MNKQEAGRLGGRPRLLTLNELRQQQPLEAQINIKEDMGTPSHKPKNSLKELRRLYLRQGSNGYTKNSNGQGDLPAISLPGKE